VSLLNDWDDDAADRLFTDNVAWDDSYERRRRTVADVVPLTLERVAPINEARGRAICTTPTGARVTITLTLGVALPLRVQDYEVSAHT
jgi:hypothetical protein